jgi:phosphatidate cytidylyltransferase
MESREGNPEERQPRRTEFERAIDLFEGLEDEPVAEESAEPEPQPPSHRRVLRGETARRILVALPWIAFTIAITILGGLPFTVAMVGVGLVCLREYFVMTAPARPIQIAAYVAVTAMIVAAHFGTAFHVLLVGTACFPLLFFFGADRKHRDGVTVSIGITLLGTIWIGLPLVHAVLLRDLPDHGAALLIDVLVGTFATDTGAYATGRMFGSHRKIAPNISPNKTLEGLIGGFLIGTMGFWFAGLYQDWLSGIDALIIGAAVAAIAPVGDLFASLVKRDLGRKDTGRLFGPHGGLLDRLDAVLFTIVFGYYLSIQLVY